MKDPIRKGAWIASTKKHLDRLQYSPEVSEFAATEIAGKAANLLALMQADERDRVSPEALNAYCVSAKIRPAERPTVLKKLQDDQRIEVLKKGEKIEAIDVYTFSKEEVLKSAARIFDASDPTPRDVANIEGLEHVCLLPRAESELVDHLTKAGFKDRDAVLTVKLQQELGLAGVDRSPALAEPIIFNEHAFVKEPSKIVAALKALKPQERQTLLDVQHYVETTGCTVLDELAKKFPPDVLRLMEGLGLLDRQEVVSPFGNASFATLPQTFGVYGGKLGIGVDCFHHAKMLLCCLTFGTVKSIWRRGKINNPVDILNSLLRGNEVGPCTAIGQDYVTLEKEGVVSLRRARHKVGEQYYMRLRKREVGELAKQVFLYKRTYSDTGILALPNPSPTHDYVNPQDKRAQILAVPVGPVEEVRAKLLTALRT